MFHIRRPAVVITIFLTVTLVSCASTGPTPESRGIVISQATIPAITDTRSDLRSLPDPVGKITVAVYGFRDLTGQNKPAPASGFSSAVTQGAESVLIQALLDSGWFTPVERSGLQNLLTERDFWDRTLRSQGGGRTVLAPLPPASIILEGGIIGYDFNIRTGGAGAKYLGIGGGQKYREDVVTINLRVVNAQTGSILHSVVSSKTLFSRSVDTSIFSFVSFDSLLEAEAGYAYNESIQQGVVEAIESGVINLIADGILAGTWNLRDPNEIKSDVWSRFQHEGIVREYLDRSIKLGSVNPSTKGVPELGALSKGDGSSPPEAERAQVGARDQQTDIPSGVDNSINKQSPSRALVNSSTKKSINPDGSSASNAKSPIASGTPPIHNSNQAHSSSIVSSKSKTDKKSRSGSLAANGPNDSLQSHIVANEPVEPGISGKSVHRPVIESESIPPPSHSEENNETKQNTSESVSVRSTATTREQNVSSQRILDQRALSPQDIRQSKVNDSKGNTNTEGEPELPAPAVSAGESGSNNKSSGVQTEELQTKTVKYIFAGRGQDAAEAQELLRQLRLQSTGLPLNLAQDSESGMLGVQIGPITNDEQFQKVLSALGVLKIPTARVLEKSVE